jgi:hypothetical protein
MDSIIPPFGYDPIMPKIPRGLRPLIHFSLQALPGLWICRDFVFQGKRLLSIEVLDMSYGWALFLERVGWNLKEALWDPNSFCGIPFLANPATRSLYPPDVALRLIAGVPAEWLFSWLVLLHYLLIGWGAFLWLRSCGRRVLSAHLGGWLWGGCGFLAVRTGLADPGFLFASTWFPWILWCLIRIEKPASAPLLVLFGFFEILAGRPDMTFYLVNLLAVWYLVRWGWRVRHPVARKRLVRVTARLGFCTLLLLLLTALQLGATADLQSHSSGRSGQADFEFAATDSMYPPQILLSLVPGGLSDPNEETGFNHLTQRWIFQNNGAGYHEVYFYLGQFTWVLALVGMVSGRGRERWFWGMVAFLSIPIAFGKFLPFFGLLFDWVPGWNRFRVPPRVLVCLLPALSYLAAQGFEGVLDRLKVPRARVSLLLGFFSLFLLYAVLGAIARPFLLSQVGSAEFLTTMGIPLDHLPKVQSDLVRDFRSALAIAALVLIVPTGLVWLAMRQKIPVQALQYGVPLFLLAEICFFNGRYNHGLTRFQFADAFPESDLIEAHRTKNGEGRLLVLGSSLHYRARPLHPWFFPGRLFAYDVRSPNGYGPFLLKDYVDTFERIAPEGRTFNKGLLLYLFFLEGIETEVFRYFQSSSIISPQPPPDGYNLLARKSFAGNYGFTSELFLLEDPNRYPRAFFVPSSATAEFPAPAPDIGSATVTDFSNTRLVLQTEGEGGRLVLLETYHPAWKGWAEGAETEVSKFGGCFRSVEIPAGNREVVFDFTPGYWVWGVRLFWGGLAGWLGLIIVSIKQPPRRRLAA